MSDHWTDRLPRDCCKDAVAWCRSFDTPEAAWSVCERGDWMMWILRARAGLSGAVAVYAAIIAAYAAYAADAANADKDKVLFKFAALVEEILIEMEVPGVKWLPLLEAT